MWPIGSITTAFAGESGRAPAPLPVKSTQFAPAFVVCQTCPGPPVKPITVTYAVLPVASELSIATLEIGNSLPLMLFPPGPFKVTLAKLEATPETGIAFVVTQTFPPMGEARLLGPGPSVVA